MKGADAPNLSLGDVHGNIEFPAASSATKIRRLMCASRGRRRPAVAAIGDTAGGELRLVKDAPMCRDACAGGPGTGGCQQGEGNHLV